MSYARRLGDAKPLRAGRSARSCALLGFALAASVHSQRTVSQLAAARPDDLVRILDDLDSRSSSVRVRRSPALERTQQQLAGSGSDAAALAEARKRTADLGHPGRHASRRRVPESRSTITDPQHAVVFRRLRRRHRGITRRRGRDPRAGRGPPRRHLLGRRRRRAGCPSTVILWRPLPDPRDR